MSAPQTPTTSEISDNIVAQISAQIAQTVPLMPKSFIRVLAKALAGVIVVLYKYAGFIWLQMFVRTASDQDTTINGVVVNPLKEWGRLVGISDPKSSTQAVLTISIPVLTQGGTLASGTQLINSSTGVVYLLTGDVELNASTVAGVVTASGDQDGGDGSGTIGNVADGTTLNFVSSLPTVSTSVTVTSTTTTGADAEESDAYRQRILDRFQKRPQGGAYADYEQWGEEAEGIANVYPYTSPTPGQVDLYVESATETDGIPTAAQLQAVLDVVELDSDGLATRRPAGALVNAFPISRLAFDIRILGISVPSNLAGVKTQIEAAVTEHLLSREPYIVGLDVGTRKDLITTTAIGGIVSDIVTAAGGYFTSIEITQDTATITLYILGIGEKAKAGSFAYV